MISASTETMLRSAATLARQADTIDQAGMEFEALLRARHDLRGVLFRMCGGVRRLERRRKRIAHMLRTQNLFLRECARRFRSVQSQVISCAEKL